jgi:hypothetical protein
MRFARRLARSRPRPHIEIENEQNAALRVVAVSTTGDSCNLFAGYRESYIAMFTAYLDASGNKRSRVLAVAGFVSVKSKWEKFETEWRKLLPATVEFFHMKDFVSSRKGWESWKDKPIKRAWIIAELVKCIRKHTHKGFAASMATKDYNLINSEFEFAERARNPYPFVAMGCLKQLKDWAKKKDIDYRKVLCVFEYGDEDQGQLLELARRDGFNAISQKKADIRAFDCCDLAAYRTKAILDDSFYRELAEDRATELKIKKSLDQLEMIVQENGVLTAERMRGMCLQARLPRRQV